VMMAILAPLAGRLADRYPPRLLSIAGVSAVLVATMMAMRLSVRSSLTAVTLVLAVQGLGFALFSSPNMTIIMSSGAKGAMSLASALGAKARSLGMVMGMLVTAVLVSLEIGNEPIARYPDRFIHVMTTAFAVLAVLTAAALTVGLVTRARRWPAAPE
jgi:MFS family permease